MESQEKRLLIQRQQAEIEALKSRVQGYYEIVTEMIGGAEDVPGYNVCVGRVDYEMLVEFNQQGDNNGK